jgi:hypothetical protein
MARSCDLTIKFYGIEGVACGQTSAFLLCAIVFAFVLFLAYGAWLKFRRD